jgi:hypothetical protein
MEQETEQTWPDRHVTIEQLWTSDIYFTTFYIHKH